jgi:hypothetical protein
MNEDQINKVETLVGYLEAIRDGKYPVGIRHTEIPAVIEEAKEWIQEEKATLTK